MDAKKIYLKFIEKYPNYERLIVSYEDIGDNAIKFKLSDGKSAVYYPLIAEGKYKKKKKSTPTED